MTGYANLSGYKGKTQRRIDRHGDGVFVYDLSYNIISHSLIITLVKSNMIKYKSLIFIGILILLLFIPVSIEYRSGGIAGINEERYVNILMIPMKTNSFK